MRVSGMSVQSVLGGAVADNIYFGGERRAESFHSERNWPGLERLHYAPCGCFPAFVTGEMAKLVSGSATKPVNFAPITRPKSNRSRQAIIASKLLAASPW